MANVTPDRLAEAYMKIRAKREALKEEYTAQDAALEEKQKLISRELLNICKELETDSLKTKHGTISRYVKERYWCSDFGPFLEYVKEHDALHLLEQRVAQKNMKQWIEDHESDLPPAMNCDRSYDIKVYKPRKEL